MLSWGILGPMSMTAPFLFLLIFGEPCVNHIPFALDVN